MYSVSDVIDFLSGIEKKEGDILKNNIKTVSILYNNGTKIDLCANAGVDKPAKKEMLLVEVGPKNES